MGACAALGISNQDALSEDLENDPFLNSALQRFTCEVYYRFGLLLAPLSIGIITSRHYFSEHNKNGEQTSGDNEGPATAKGSGNEQKLMGPQGPSTSSKSDGGTQAQGPYAGLHGVGPLLCLGAAIAAELMIGFWFRVGVVLAVKILESLEYCIRRKC